MTGREKPQDETTDVHDQDAEPSLNAPGEEGPTGITAPAEGSDGDGTDEG